VENNNRKNKKETSSTVSYHFKLLAKSCNFIFQQLELSNKLNE